MKRKETYLSRDFRETAAQRFPARAKELNTAFDIPYHDTCTEYGCPELCRCFCDSDDISYTGLHPKLIWERSITLGRGNDRCDFCMKVRYSPMQRSPAGTEKKKGI